MAINVPESVFSKYYEVIDSTFNIFGVECLLVFTETVEEATANDNVPDVPSINVHRRNQDQYRRDAKTYKQVEKTETIKLKVYWDFKDFIKPSPSLVLPNNSIQTIFFMSDLQKINRAKELIVHKGIKDTQEMHFKKSGQPFPMGLRQNRYAACFWEAA
jgi:hypothetical protein